MYLRYLAEMLTNIYYNMPQIRTKKPLSFVWNEKLFFTHLYVNILRTTCSDSRNSQSESKFAFASTIPRLIHCREHRFTSLPLYSSFCWLSNTLAMTDIHTDYENIQQIFNQLVINLNAKMRKSTPKHAVIAIQQPWPNSEFRLLLKIMRLNAFLLNRKHRYWIAL